MQFVIQLKI